MSLSTLFLSGQGAAAPQLLDGLSSIGYPSMYLGVWCSRENIAQVIVKGDIAEVVLAGEFDPATDWVLANGLVLGPDPADASQLVAGKVPDRFFPGRSSQEAFNELSFWCRGQGRSEGEENPPVSIFSETT